MTESGTAAPPSAAARRRRRARLLLAVLLVIGALLAPHDARAQNVVCSPNSSYPGVNFGSASTVNAALNYTCTSYLTTSVSFTICSGLGTPSYPGTVAQPLMQGPGGATLKFNLYTNAALTVAWTSSNLLLQSVTIPRNGTVTGSLPFYGSIPAGQGEPAGGYSAAFYQTSIGFTTNNTVCVQSGTYNGYQISGQNGTVSVGAAVPVACSVSTGSDIDLGKVSASATNIAGSGPVISVNCPSGTAYYIGLAPTSRGTNNAQNGAGLMIGSLSGNTNQVPYQLYQNAAHSSIWGNTATSTSPGNGVGGTGTGNTQLLNVYVGVPTANFNPDTYADTVTVTLNY